MTMASFLARLRRSETGVAMVEFAYSLPIVVPLFMGGAELTNYAVTKMRVSQIALHVADNASRIGTDTLLCAPRISESQTNDLLTGANLQAGNLDLGGRGRIILSSVEPIANPNPTKKFKIRWQRCFGDLDVASSYGEAGQSNLAGVGPAGRQATAPDNGATMFVEVVYDYQPLIAAGFVPATEMRETAAMTVRDDRDYNGNSGKGIFNDEDVTPSACPST
jgi:hypothetical protein